MYIHRTLFNLKTYNTKIALQTVIKCLKTYLSALIVNRIHITLPKADIAIYIYTEFNFEEWKVQIDQIINSYSWPYK